MPPLDFSAVFPDKISSVQNATEVKKERLSSISDAADYLRNRIAQEQALDPLPTLNQEPKPIHLDRLPENPLKAFERGGSEALQGMVGLAYGLGAGVGAVAESVAGEGGLSTQFKKAMVEKYVENEQDMAKYSRPEDSLTHSWEKAKEGDYGAMLSWATHGTGYVTAQLASMLTGSGLIAGGTSAFGKKAVGQLMGSLVEREAGRIASQTAGKIVTDAILKKATKNVATKVGMHLGMAATGFGMEGGEIMGDLAKQSVEQGIPLTGSEIGKGLAATTLAGLVEYSETLLGLKALGGKLGKIPGAKITENISGLAGKAARGAVTGVKSAVAEAAQEATQTGIERWGKGQEVASEEGIQEIIDAAGLGALGGGPASIGGLVTRSIKEQEEAEEKRAERQRIKPQVAPKFKETVNKAAETEEGVKKYSDPKSPDFNETTAINVAHTRVNKEEVSPFEKIKTGNDAIKIFQDMYKERADLFNQIKTATDEELQADPEKYVEMETKVKELNTRIKDTTPLIQAIAKANEKTDSEQALDDFRTAFIKEDGVVSGNVSKTLRNLFGSSGSHAFFDSNSDDYVDIETQLQANKGNIHEDEISELTAASELQKATSTILKQVDKSAGRVNTDILEGSPEGDYKGISQHINDIVISLDAGDTKQAKNNLNRLSTWANKRADRATTFEGMYEAYKDNSTPSPAIQESFNHINNDRLAQGYKEPYYINDKTEGLVQFMKLEADALQKAVAYGESMFENRPDVTNSVERDSRIAATPSAPVGTTITPQSTPGKTGQEGVDALDIKSLDLEAATLAFNTENEKPFKSRNNEMLKELRDHIQNLRKTEDVETTLTDDPVIEYSEQQIDRTKETPPVTISDKALNELKAYFSGHKKEDVDSIFLVPHEKHPQGKELKAIGNAFGVQVFLYDSKSNEINKNAGVATYKDGFVFINQNTPESYLGILGHEITHQLKRKHSDLYKKLEDYLVVDSKEFAKFKKNLLANVKGTPAETEYNDTAHEELICMFVGEQFGKRSFWEDIYNKDKTLFEKLTQIAKKILEKAMRSVAPVEKYFTDLKQAHQVVSDVIKEAVRREKVTPPKEGDNVSWLSDGKENTGTVKILKGDNTAVVFDGSTTHRLLVWDLTQIEKTEESQKTEPKEIVIKHPEVTLRGLKKSEYVSDDNPAIKAMEIFHKAFESTLTFILNPINPRFIDKDPIQYLVQEDGTLPKDVVESLSATAYKWLATQASGYIQNDDAAMRRILQMGNDKETPITSDAQRVLRHIGVQANYITESLGKEAAKLAGIKVGDKAPYDLKERMELAFGSMIIATLEQQKFLEPVYVLAGNAGNNPYGFDGIRAKQYDQTNARYTNVTEKFTIEKPAPGEQTLTFYRPSSQPGRNGRVASTKIKSIGDAWQTDRNAWDQIYGTGKNTRDYSWTPYVIKEDAQATTKRAGALLTKEQTANLAKNMNTPWVANAPAMNVFLALGLKAQEKILGKQDTEFEHITEHETNKGINLGIDRSIERLNDWLTDAANQDNKYASEFYIPAEFWLQERMGMIGSISPQGDKLHRSLFNMKDWERSMDLNSKEDYNLFMLGIGQYLDIEFAKEGGFMATVKKTEEKLQEPVMQEGIKAIKSIIKRSNIEKVTPGEVSTTAEETKAIVAAVEAGEVKAQSLKSLVEYTRYLMAKESGAKEFKTTMTVEIDGTANGPAFGRWQFMSQPADPLLHLAALQTGGFRFHENKKGDSPWDLSEHLSGDLNHDAYQITGFVWAKKLLDKEQFWAERVDDSSLRETQRDFAQKSIDKMHAFQEIMGNPISATGNVSNEMRKLAKPPTMKTMYSMGKAKLELELIHNTIDSIHQQAKKAILKNDVESLHKLNLAVHTLTETWLFPVTKKNNEWVTNSLEIKEALHRQLSNEAIKNLTDHIKHNQGPTMYDTVKEVFAEIKSSTQVLNKGLSLATVFYNTLRQGYLDQATALKAKNMGVSREEVILTNEDIKKVDKRLENILPQVQGAGGSFLPMAQMDRARDYKAQHPVVQGYRKKDNHGRKIASPSRKTTYPHQIKQMADPGVSGTVKGVQHLDAAVANKLMAHFSFLNNHDGFTTSIFDAVPLAQKANEIFTKVNSTYSLSESIDQLLKTSNELFYLKAEKLQEDFPEFDFQSTLYSQMLQTNLGQKYDPDLEKFVSISLEEAIPTAFNIKDEVHAVAQENKTQRDLLRQALQGTQQYAFPGGEYTTGNKPVKTLYNTNPSEITKQRTASLNEDIIKMQQQRQDLGYVKEVTPEEVVEVLGSTQGDVSTDPVDYELEMRVNEENLIRIYDAIKNDGTKKDSVTHDTHLKSILDKLVKEVIEPLDLFITKSPDKETAGIFDMDSGQVFIQSHSGLLNQGISMSTGEVYTHEMIHAVIHQALDTNKRLRSKVSRLYNIVFKEMQRKHNGEEFRVFLNDPALDVNDPANQPEIELAKSRYDYFFRVSDKRGGTTKNAYTGITMDRTISNHLDEFMAYALTNENFSHFLKRIELKDTEYTNSTWDKIRGKNIQETLLNLFQAIIDFFRGRFTDVNKKTAYAEAEALAYQLAKVQSKYKTKRFETLRNILGFSDKLHELGNGIIKKAFHKTVPKAATWKKGYEILMDDPSKAGDMFRELYNYIDSMDQGIIKTTVQDARGMTSRLSDYYQLLTRRKRVLDAAKEQASHTYSTLANEFFKKEPTATEKITLTKAGLRTDAIVLLDSLGFDKLLEVYQNDAIRHNEIKKILDELSDINKFPETAKYANYYDRASMALGDFIIHSQFRQGEDAGLNAQLIAELSGTNKAGKVKTEDSSQVEPLIDQLASLYAIGSLSASHRTAFATIMAEDRNGVYKTLQLHKTLKTEAQNALFSGSKRLFIKGYTKAILNNEIDLKYGILSEESEMTKIGYTRSPKPLPRDHVDPYKNQDIYVYTARTGRLNNLASGILSYTRNKAKGTSTRTLIDQFDPMSARGLKTTKTILQSKQDIRNSMFTEKRNPDAKLVHNMIAKVDRSGNIIDYRYMMSEATKDAYLDQVNDFDTVLGAMAGQIVDKHVTPVINEELVKRLKQTYDAEFFDNPAAFVKIGPNADDPDMIEQYYMIPEKTQKVIAKVWGPTKTMYVPKDLMTLAFGYRKYSVVDAFIKKPVERSKIEQMIVSLTNKIVKDSTGETGRGIKTINTIEQLATELTHYAKDNIIVKSLTVTLGNFGSNLIYLRMRGVPTTTILKFGLEAVKYGIHYQADVMKINKLGIEQIQLKRENTPEAKQRLKIIENKLMQLHDTLNRNPVADSIDSGLMPSLVDDVDTQGQKNYFPGRIEKYVEDKTKNLPNPVKTVGKVLFLSQDTEAYKVLNNGVKLTDFVGRHVLYNYYTKTKGMDPKEAVQRSIEEFINFDIPSHRITEYLNEIGLLWFTKYATRIPMVAMKAILDKPFDSIMSYLLSSHIGFDNIIDSAIPNIGYKIGTSPTAWAGSIDEVITAQLIGSILP